MKTKTADLTGPALDWAVTVAEKKLFGVGERALMHFIRNRGMFLYSSDWAKAGPIIERECICTYASGACTVAPKNPDYWVAEILDTSEMITRYGPTPLIAAMRCYVASKLGDEVDIPEELLK